MVDDPAVKTSEHTPIVAALLGLPGISQIGRATGLIASAPSSEPKPESASKIVAVHSVRQGSAAERAANARRTTSFLTQTAPSRKAYDGGGSGRENSPGAMSPASKASISVIPIGETTGATYTDFILTSLTEQDVEKTEIVETFGAFHLFTSGRFARKYQFVGSVRAHPVNHAAKSTGAGQLAAAVPASVKLRNLYEQHLRATVQAVRQTFTRVTVDRDSYDGWITTFNLSRDANTEFLAQFSFTMVAYRRTNEKDAEAKNLLSAFDAQRGAADKPKQRMLAEVAAAIGTCEPVWYVNGVKASASDKQVDISEDDSGLSAIQKLRITLHSESGANTAVGGTCKLTAKLGGKDIELSSIGIANGLLNLTTPQDVFTDNVVFRPISDAAAGAATVNLVVTATGTSISGAPTAQTLTIPLTVKGTPSTRISGYNIYGGAAGATLLGTLTFPDSPAQTPPYKAALLDTVTIPVARSSLGGVPTAFMLSAEPICVDAKTGASTTPPAGLQLKLSIYNGDTNVAATVQTTLTGTKASIAYTYTTDLEAAGGTTELQKMGATAVDLVVAIPTQPGLISMPMATSRFKFSTVLAPFTLVSPILVHSVGSVRAVIALLVRPGLDAAAAKALVKYFQFTARNEANSSSISLSSSGGNSTFGGVAFSGFIATVVQAPLSSKPGDQTWIVLTCTSDVFAGNFGTAGTDFVAAGPAGIPLPRLFEATLFAPAIAKVDPGICTAFNLNRLP